MFCCYYYNFFQISYGGTIWSRMEFYFSANNSHQRMQKSLSFTEVVGSLINAHSKECEVSTGDALCPGKAESYYADKTISRGTKNMQAQGSKTVSPDANGRD